MQFEEHDSLALLGSLNEAEGKHVPKRLYTAGDVSLLHRAPRVAIIGSRKASAVGLKKARAVARTVVERNGVVVSGLAAGIDAAAHRGAIEAGGKTFAVIGTALGHVYPKENAPLQDELMTEHLVISQFGPGYPTTRNNFVLRNRTMALLAQASVIVEAGARSGTEHQGWEAIRLGRLLLLPGALVDASFGWPGKMCDYGAVAFRNTVDLKALMDEYLPSVATEALSELPF